MELLSPAGSLEKLKVAVSYGANAVYVGGQKFGLRTAAENFTYEELAQGVKFAHERGAVVYVVLNSFLFDSDLEDLPEFLSYIESIGVDAVIVSDLGVIETVHQHSKIPVHLSTQASCLNELSGQLWKKMGVTRLILGREASLEDAWKIKQATGLEVELFIHGSMCMAYSGNCVISNFTQGRDSNRGGCAHSCRFEYTLKSDLGEKSGFFMSSKDLNGLRLLADFKKFGIDSIKVEGRMKSHLYAATVSSVYRQALDELAANGALSEDSIVFYAQELEKISHRSYTEASLENEAGPESIFHEREHQEGDYKIAGHILEVIEDQCCVLEVKNSFNLGTTLEVLTFDHRVIEIVIDEIQTMGSKFLDRTKPSTLVKIPYQSGIKKLNIVRFKETAMIVSHVESEERPCI